MGVSTNQLIAIVALVGGAFLVSGMSFSGVTDNAPEVNLPSGDDSSGIGADESVTLSVDAYDRTEDGSTSVATDAYAYADGYQIADTKALTSGSRDDISGLNGQDSFTAIAFDDTYDYGKKVEGTADEKTVREDLDVYEGATTSDLTLDVKDENGDSISSDSLGADEEVQYNGLEVSVDNNNLGYNPHMIAVDYTGNISEFEMPNAQSTSAPEAADAALSGDADAAFLPSGFSANEGEPMLGGYEDTQTGNMIVTADSSGTASGDQIEFAVLDLAPYINQDNEIEFGVQDDSDSNVGVSVQTKTLSLS